MVLNDQIEYTRLLPKCQACKLGKITSSLQLNLKNGWLHMYNFHDLTKII